MFDIGFFELIIIAMVGLFVIGPERLPETIKTVALWVGRIKRNILETRTEIEQQLGADEIRRQLQNEQVLHNLEKMKDTRKELENKIRQWQNGEPIEQLLDPKQISADGTNPDETPAAVDGEQSPTSEQENHGEQAPEAKPEQHASPDPTSREPSQQSDQAQTPAQPENEDTTKKNNGL